MQSLILPCHSLAHVHRMRPHFQHFQLDTCDVTVNAMGNTIPQPAASTRCHNSLWSLLSVLRLDRACSLFSRIVWCQCFREQPHAQDVTRSATVSVLVGEFSSRISVMSLPLPWKQPRPVLCTRCYNVGYCQHFKQWPDSFSSQISWCGWC